jgi:hypothetical protein
MLGFIFTILAVFYLVKMLTPGDWSSLRGGLKERFSRSIIITIALLVVVFVGIFILI